MSHKFRGILSQRKTWIIVISILLFLIIVPSIIIGELYYSFDRSQQYNDLTGFTSIQLKTFDGINLQGWYQDDRANVILAIHGHADSSHQMNERYTKIFNEMGFDVVFIDLRNHGRSDDSAPINMGVTESIDVKTALEWVKTQNWDKIILFGTSMGAVASLITAFEYQDILDGLILDSLFNDYKKVIDNNQIKHKIPLIWRKLSQSYLILRNKNFEFPDILQLLKDTSSIPILVLHGNKDVEAPINIVKEINDLGLDYVTTAIIEQGQHSRLFAEPLFQQVISQFILSHT